MSTIKQKIDMTAHELITYGIQNNIKNIILEAINEKYKERAIIQFNENAMPIVSRDVNIHHVFEVKVEEPITEDTKLKEIILITNNSIYSEKYYNYSINDVLTNNEGYYEEVAMLILEPEPLIIWTQEKGLVE
ncbi:hypothetical protein MUA27_10550 [Mammaliicoccus sciuri]|uniref:hypothetical protein n=1 Tax=Mammaliicoccus sciuri TaxID=1296 RepID=UPI0021D20290|nr:hypothetical protein [Mammaliicoccus sciuri]UXU77306.1 hypothetical protein MUA27_10550 [Mammaliicoccus sciuri]